VLNGKWRHSRGRDSDGTHNGRSDWRITPNKYKWHKIAVIT